MSTRTALEMIPVAGAALGGIYNIATAGRRAAEQKAANEEERRKQIEGSKELTDYNSLKQEELYKKTTAPLAMLKQYKEAGLSPGLMYGGSGGGGSIPQIATQTTSRGAVPDANAARGNDMNAIMGLAQLGLMKAQTENINADTEKKQSEVPAIKAGTENTIADTDFKRINTQYANESLRERLEIIAQEANKAISIAHQEQIKENVSENTFQAQVQKIKQDATNAAIQGAAMESGIQLNDARINEITQDIMRKWQELNVQKDRTGYEHGDRLKAIEEYTSTTLKAAGIQAAGRLVSDVVGIATRKMPQGSITTRTNGNGEVISESYTRPNK